MVALDTHTDSRALPPRRSKSGDEIMMKLKPNSILVGAATAAAVTIAVSGSALAHGGGIGGHMGGNIGGHLGHITTTMTRTDNVSHIGERDARRFRFHRFGYVGVVASPACFYKWTNFGQVRICPDIDD
jgi:hypothetical protein